MLRGCSNLNEYVSLQMDHIVEPIRSSVKIAAKKTKPEISTKTVIDAGDNLKPQVRFTNFLVFLKFFG